jgi:hypothetical protein
VPEVAVPVAWIQAAVQLFSCVCHTVGYIRGIIFHWNQVVAVQSIHIYLVFSLMPSACYGCDPVTGYEPGDASYLRYILQLN